MAQINVWKNIEESDLIGYTLIVPSVAVGNVGQLACDLLISSLQMKKIAKIHSLAIIPVLGYDPYDLNAHELSLSCELYKSEEKKISVLQIRAPLVYKYARKFLSDIVETFKQKKKIKDIVILTSSYAHEKKHISTSPFRYKMNDVCQYSHKIKELNWTEHETSEELKIFGGGFASLLYKISAENSLPCLVIYKYCSEGDNIPDAYDIIQQLSNIIPLFSGKKDLMSQLVQPVSWKFLFGRPPPKDIY